MNDLRPLLRSDDLLPFAVTAGEPAGIGPDLCVQFAQQQRSEPLVVVADPELLIDRARRLRLPLETVEWRPGEAALCVPGAVSVLPVNLDRPAVAGQLEPGNARYVLRTLETALDGCLAGRFAALVTGPVHKAVINEAGIPFTGHTEFLAVRAGVGQVVMMLATPGLRVALVTTHLPLAQVPAAITRERLTRTLAILHRDLRQRFRIAAPVIAVCGLNPHAGEEGHLGREEIEVIGPVLEALRQEGMQLKGPLPADTAFTPASLAGVDAVLAMYHDQGLPVLKHKGFGHAVNVTLGLPVVRTSVDHGTALDLAGTGRAHTGSLEYAIEVAAEMTR